MALADVGLHADSPLARPVAGGHAAGAVQAARVALAAHVHGTPFVDFLRRRNVNLGAFSPFFLSSAQDIDEGAGWRGGVLKGSPSDVTRAADGKRERETPFFCQAEGGEKKLCRLFPLPKRLAWVMTTY